MEGSEYPLVQIVKSAKEIRVYGLMSWARVLNKCGTTEDTNKEHKRVLYNMKMHGQFFQQQTKLALVDIEGIHKWLHAANIKVET